MRRPRQITLFSWGYKGWGNATGRLVSAVDEAERQERFRPPIFVDIRYRRNVRAVGFRKRKFEKRLGHERYRWMKSLGNKNIGTRREVEINCVDAVEQLLDLALDAAANRRRVIFFCSCASPGDARTCHRAKVASALIRAARRRSINCAVVEWPGGQPDREATPLRVLDSELRGALANRKTVRIPGAGMPKRLLGLPWGALIRLNSHREVQLVPAGPARFIDGAWALPIFGQPKEGDTPQILLLAAKRLRRQLGLNSWKS